MHNHHIHWSTFVSKIEPHVAIDVLTGYLNIEPEILDKGNRYYKRRADFGKVARVYWSGTVEDECCVELTGTACEQLGRDTVLDLYNLFEGKCTRLDVAVDGADFTPKFVKEYLGCNRDAEIPMQGLRSRISKKAYEWHDSYDGDSLYLGSSESKRQLLIYDRNKDANGKNFTRCELRLRKTHADKAIQLLESDRKNFEQHSIALIRDFVDFVEMDESNISRASLVGWWSDFVGNIKKTAIKYTDKSVTSIESIVEYMLKNSPNFMVTVMAFVSKTGKSIEQTCDMIMCEGMKRSKPKHNQLIMRMNDLDMTTLKI